MTATEKVEYIRIMNTERDIRNQIQYAKDVGREEGKDEENLAIARELKSLGVDINIIVQSTHLSKEQIETL